MRLHLTTLIIACSIGTAIGQSVGINNTSPDSSAILDIVSTKKGVLLPRMTSTQANGIYQPKKGLIYYNTDEDEYRVYDGSNWKPIYDDGLWEGGAFNTLRSKKTRVSIGPNSGVSTLFLNSDSAAIDLNVDNNLAPTIRFVDNGNGSKVMGLTFQDYHNGSISYLGGLGTDYNSNNLPNFYIDRYTFNNNEPEFFIDTNSLVGIHNKSPKSQLHVGGGLTVEQHSGTPTAGTIEFRSGGFRGHDGSNWVDFAKRNWWLTTDTSTFTTRKVGIGTNQLTAEFEVSGSSKFTLLTGSSFDVTLGTKSMIYADEASRNLGFGTDQPTSPFHFATSDGEILLRPFSTHCSMHLVNKSTSTKSAAYRLWDSNTSSGYDIGMDYNLDNSQNWYVTKVGLSYTQPDLFLDFNGKLGVGTSTPNEKLHVTGAIVLGQSGMSGVVAGTVHWNGSDLQVYNGSNWKSTTHQVFSENGLLVTKYNSGTSYRLGINVQNPSEEFELVGDAKFLPTGAAQELSIQSNGIVDPQIVCASDNYGVLGSTTNKWYQVHTNNLTVYTSFTNLSDRRMKENILPINNALDKVKQINGYTYDLLTDDLEGLEGKKKQELVESRKDKHGLIAQELEAVIPELVQDNPSTDLKSVDYIGLIPILIEAIKEQQEQIEYLQSIIE